MADETSAEYKRWRHFESEVAAFAELEKERELRRDYDFEVSAFLEFVKDRKYSEALERLYAGLRLAGRLDIAEDELLECPLLTPHAGAVAALFQDHELLNLMVKIGPPGTKDKVANYTLLIAAVQTIRDLLRPGRPVARATLLAAVPTISKGQATLILTFLAGNKEFVRYGVPTGNMCVTPDYPRSVAATLEASIQIPLADSHPWKLNLDTYKPVTIYPAVERGRLTTTVEPVSWKPAERWDGRFRCTVSAKNSTWVVDDISKLGDVLILDKDGHLFHTLKLSHSVRKAFSTVGQEYMALVDAHGRVWVYHEDGTSLQSFEMPPELQKSNMSPASKADAGYVYVRSVAVNRHGTRVAIGTRESIWLLDMNGALLYRRTLPHAFHNYGYPAPSRLDRESPEVLRALELWGLTPDMPDPMIADIVAREDPIRFPTEIREADTYIGEAPVKVFLSTYESPTVPIKEAMGHVRSQGAHQSWFSGDDHLFVIGEWGTLLEIAHDGELLAYDALDCAPDRVIRMPDSQLVLCGDRELMLFDEGQFGIQPLATGTGPSTAFGTTAASCLLNTVTLTSLANGSSHSQQLAFAPRLVVPFNNGAWFIGKTRSVRLVLDV